MIIPCPCSLSCSKSDSAMPQRPFNLLFFLPLLQDIFDSNVKCTDSHGSFSVCTARKGEFFDKINYFQLHMQDDYRAMCESVENSLEQDKSGSVKEVLLYLAVPPSIFLPALRSFKAQCTFTGQNVSIKVKTCTAQAALHKQHCTSNIAQAVLHKQHCISNIAQAILHKQHYISSIAQAALHKQHCSSNTEVIEFVSFLGILWC